MTTAAHDPRFTKENKALGDVNVASFSPSEKIEPFILKWAPTIITFKRLLPECLPKVHVK